MNKELYNLEHDEIYSTEAAKSFVKHAGISEVTRELLGDLVDKIIIDSDKNIKIIFKFQVELKHYLN